MKRATWWASCCWPVLVLLATGCGESEADRKQREQAQRRAEAQRAELASGRLQAQQVTNAVIPAKKAAAAKDQAALASAVSELKKLGAPAVQRLQEEASKGEKADRVAAIVVLGEMGSEASAAVPTLEGILKEEPDAELKEAASKALAKIRAP
jgi:hypothetical protein